MKLVLLLSTAALLAACNNSAQQEEATVEESQVEEVQTEEVSDNTMLESDQFKLELLDVEVIQSSLEDSQGLYLTYNLTNTSDESVVPSDLLYGFTTVEQTTDTSIVELEGGYSSADAFGEDVETYNAMVDKENAMLDQLLPGKTIEAYQAVYLEDDSLPISISILDQHSWEPVDTIEVEL